MSAQNTEPNRPKKRVPPGRRWQKGESGNPGGRPKGLGSYVREKCGEDGRVLIDMLFAIVTNDVQFFEQHAIEVPNTKEVLQATEMLMDRGWGKATQAVEVGGMGGGPVAVTVTFVGAR